MNWLVDKQEKGHSHEAGQRERGGERENIRTRTRAI
jgi:hypothetical protein